MSKNSLTSWLKTQNQVNATELIS